jgi:hypothetical protein
VTHEADQKHSEEDEEKNLRYDSRESGNGPESQEARDDGDQQKDQSVIEHLCFILPSITTYANRVPIKGRTALRLVNLRVFS